VSRANFLHAFRDAVMSEHGPSCAAARLVAVALAKTANQNTLESFAGAKHLAVLCKLSERTIYECLASLVSEGWLEERTKSKGRDYWLKIRRPVIPAAAVPASRTADSLQPLPAVETGLPAAIAGSQGEGLPATSAGLPAKERLDCLQPLQGNSYQRTPVLNSCATAPSPAAGAGSLAPKAEDVAAIRDLYLRAHYTAAEIFEKLMRARGVTLDQVQRVTNDLDRRGLASQGPKRIAVLPPQQDNTGAGK